MNRANLAFCVVLSIQLCSLVRLSQRKNSALRAAGSALRFTRFSRRPITGIFFKNTIWMQNILPSRAAPPACRCFSPVRCSLYFPAVRSPSMRSPRSRRDDFLREVSTFSLQLIVRPDIKSANLLQGKSLGITSFGSVTELATRMALEKLGVNPKQVTIVQVAEV